MSAYGLSWLKKHKTKHSKNIIDLIEVGDYVNGSEVTSYYYVGKQKVLVINNEKITYEENENFISNLGIKTVLTKEQYEANSYKLKED
jgi:tmRNA-binding protein